MMQLNGYASWGFLVCVLTVIDRFGCGSKKVFLGCSSLYCPALPNGARPIGVERKSIYHVRAIAS